MISSVKCSYETLFYHVCQPDNLTLEVGLKRFEDVCVLYSYQV